MFSAEIALRHIGKKVVEAVIDNKNKLLEILNREVEIVFPPDVAFLYIGR